MLRNARSRLILAINLLSSGVAALVLGLVYIATTTIIEAETRSVVEAELAGLEDGYRNLGVLGLATAIERRVSSSDRRDAIYLLADGRGRAIAGNLGAWPPTVEPGGGWIELELIRTDSEMRVTVAAASLKLRGGERLLVGRDASSQQRFTSVLFASAGWALLAALILSAMAGWLLTRLVFSRIADISKTADTIMTGDLDGRIPLRGTGDEFDRVAVTLNDMLERISALVSNLRMTTTSLSHDLRSPLTRLRAQLENLTSPNATEEDRSRISAQALGEVDHLMRVISNLAEIAHAEARMARTDFNEVDIRAIASDAVELYAPVAEDHRVRIVLSGSAQPVKAHRALLMQALSNLVENALRYAPPDSEIRVSVRELSNGVELSVADAGPGMPEAFVAEATKPFSTLDQSRSDGGSGLGLALVAAIASLHNGSVDIANLNPGLRVALKIQPD